MSEVDNVNFDEIEERREILARRKKAGTNKNSPVRLNTGRQQVQGRLLSIATALENAVEILKAANPLRAIAATAYDGTKSKHPHRLQLWFFSYMLHGQNQWALKQPTHRNGLWSRLENGHKDKKFGRPSLHGSCYGWSSASMREDIVNFYLSACGEGVYMTTIHRNALRQFYGCITVKDSDGNDTWIQPENKPFPSYGQFRNVVVNELGLEQVQTKVYGSALMKSKATANGESHSAKYANLLEDVHVDAYHVYERPKSIYSDEPSEPLIVAEAVCVTTGAVVGAGFSLGAETGDAYRSMLFCMAVPKDYIARLYGIPPEMLNWNMQGICAAFTSDRGPAGHRRIAEKLELRFPIKTIAPSYDGQAKAPIESTHPRNVNLEGSPTWIQSELNVIQMVKRELIRAASRNHTKNISEKLSDQAIADFAAERRVATPHHYWDYLEKRLRTCAWQMTLEEAVRAFWKPVSLPVDRDGVRLGHAHYTSNVFRETNFLAQVSNVPNLTISAYTLNLVVRSIWVEVKGRLIELERAMHVRVGDEDKIVPISELQDAADQIAELRSRTRVAIQAATNRAETNFKELTSIEWNAGQRRAGTPNRPSGTAAHEVKVLKGRTNKKGTAGI
jgi:hypothetical protein